MELSLITLKDARNILAAAGKPAMEIGQPMNVVVAVTRRIRARLCHAA